MMSDWKEIRIKSEESLERHYQRCIEMVAGIRFSNSVPQQVLALCLYCSIIELCSSTLILIQRRQFIGVPLLIRSMYEADVDLVNILNDSDYFKSLYATYLTKMTGVIQQAHNSESPGFMKAAGGIEEMRAFLREKNNELKSLKRDGHKPLQMKDRFCRAKLDEEYISSYAYLCRYSHNDIVALQNRHLRTVGDEPELKVFNEIGLQDETHLIDLADAVLLRASERVHRFFDSGSPEGIEDMYAELSALRDKWPREES
jgi:hypothetical protein